MLAKVEASRHLIIKQIIIINISFRSLIKALIILV